MKRYYLRNRLCFPIKGMNRSIIYDLNRQDYYFIPLSLYDKLSKNEVITFDDDASYKEWEALLLEKEIIFSVDNDKEDQYFPPISEAYDMPCLLSTLIIHDNFDIEKLGFIESAYVLNVSIIVNDYESVKKQEFVDLMSKLSTFEIDSIYLYVTDNKKSFNREDFRPLDGINQLFNIYIFEHLFEKDDSFDILNFVFRDTSFGEFSQRMTKEKLQVNYPHFLEALNSNNYFNEKVYVDDIGNIRNGINSAKSFGNINAMKNDKELIDLIQSDSFKTLWNVKKDDTLICKDCEFRYMCVDSRNVEQNAEGEWFHKTECNYNPYLSKWTHEEDFKSLEECGIILNSEGQFKINEKQLETVFNSVWD
ncbi:hypothetical protein [Psychroserpens algicola]|uniref:hypothetical protein n=1 Tax=Psychroserpens algicola TaxID=1719034 RepID=UPI00195447F4|nr:hypothetical protein [Psychroserpens algicola]